MVLRCGILIFVSLAERYARIVADEASLPGFQPHAAILDAVDAPGGKEMALGVERILCCRSY